MTNSEWSQVDTKILKCFIDNNFEPITKKQLLDELCESEEILLSGLERLCKKNLLKSSSVEGTTFWWLNICEVAPDSEALTIQQILGKLYMLFLEEEEVKKCYPQLYNERDSQLQTYIDLLHDYNETKDSVQILIGKLAELTGTTIKSLYKEYSLNIED